jgi:hypothetical protein
MEEIDSLDFLIRVQGEIKRVATWLIDLPIASFPRIFTALPIKWSSGFGS